MRRETQRETENSMDEPLSRITASVVQYLPDLPTFATAGGMHYCQIVVAVGLVSSDDLNEIHCHLKKQKEEN